MSFKEKIEVKIEQFKEHPEDAVKAVFGVGVLATLIGIGHSCEKKGYDKGYAKAKTEYADSATQAYMEGVADAISQMSISVNVDK